MPGGRPSPLMENPAKALTGGATVVSSAAAPRPSSSVSSECLFGKRELLTFTVALSTCLRMRSARVRVRVVCDGRVANARVRKCTPHSSASNSYLLRNIGRNARCLTSREDQCHALRNRAATGDVWMNAAQFPGFDGRLAHSVPWRYLASVGSTTVYASSAAERARAHGGSSVRCVAAAIFGRERLPAAEEA
ncbi:hypothetical protein MTO96_031904 [Rhipicephalus appendiculatus]